MRDLDYAKIRLAGILTVEELEKEIEMMNKEEKTKSTWSHFIHPETGVEVGESGKEIKISDYVSTNTLFTGNLVETFSYLYLDDETELNLDKLSREIRYSFHRKYKVKGIEQDIFSINEEGDILQNGRKLKAGKFVRTLFPELTEDQISVVVDSIRYSVKEIHLQDTEDVNGLYNNPNARITSCMRNEDVSIFDEAGFTAKYLSVNGKIIGRVLFLGRAFSKVYATSAILQEKIEEKLKEEGFIDAYEFYDIDIEPDVHMVKTNTIKGNIEDRFIPYMDILPFIHKTEDGFFFSNYKKGCFGECDSEYGTVHEIN